MRSVKFNRDDPASAQAVMEQTCPDPKVRRFLMKQLLRSAALAEKEGPRSWAVTLFHDGFRLNVGQVEAFTYFRRVVRLFLLGSLPAHAYTVGEIIPCSLRSMPQPQFIFVGGAKELERIHSALEPKHKAFVQTAAVTSKGKPRRSPYRRSHSLGLYNYASRLAGV
jgi:hypothetical protein